MSLFKIKNRNSAFRQIPAYLENFFIKVLSKIMQCIMNNKLTKYKKKKKCFIIK